jgi:hypothetical protein
VEFRTAAVVSCWISIAIISSVYLIVYGSIIADILFGVFLPIGLLVLVGLIVTIYLASNKS